MPTNVEMYDEAIRLQESGQLEAAIQKLYELLDHTPSMHLPIPL